MAEPDQVLHRLPGAELVVRDHRHRAGLGLALDLHHRHPRRQCHLDVRRGGGVADQQRVDPAFEEAIDAVALELLVAVVVEDHRLVAMPEPLLLDAMGNVDEERVAGDRRHDQSDRVASLGAEPARHHVWSVPGIPQHRCYAGAGFIRYVAAGLQHARDGGGRNTGGPGDLGKGRRFGRHGSHGGTLAVSRNALNRFVELPSELMFGPATGFLA